MDLVCRGVVGECVNWKWAFGDQDSVQLGGSLLLRIALLDGTSLMRVALLNQVGLCW